MLVLSRRKDQKILIGRDIELFVIEITRGVVKLGITAPRELPILRAELLSQPEGGKQCQQYRDKTQRKPEAQSEDTSASPPTQ